MSKRDPFRLRLGDDFNPETRCGMPRWTGGKAGNGKRLLTTWFTTGTAWRWADDEVIARLKQEHAIHPNTKYVLAEYCKNVYYANGMFYASETHKSVLRTGDFSEFVPITGTIRTCKPKYQHKYHLIDCEIVVVDGHPGSVRIEGDAFYVTDDSWPTMESFLGLDESYKPEKYRPKEVS